MKAQTLNTIVEYQACQHICRLGDALEWFADPSMSPLQATFSNTQILAEALVAAYNFRDSYLSLCSRWEAAALHILSDFLLALFPVPMWEGVREVEFTDHANEVWFMAQEVYLDRYVHLSSLDGVALFCFDQERTGL